MTRSLILLCLALCTLPLSATEESSLKERKGQFVLKTREKNLEVFTYRPANYKNGPLIVVLHGMNRNAENYREYAVPLGDRLGALIVAPHFDREQFPTEAYQRGGLTKNGNPQPEGQWTFQFISDLVAEIRQREKNPELPYYLIGHSAGGQFLTRMAAFAPQDAQRIIAGNPGSLLFPTREMPFQYGFGKLPDELSTDEAMKRYLAAPLTLFLGTSDTGEKNLDMSELAMRQGRNRIERGRACYEMAKTLAREKGWKFGWRLVEAEGVAHDAKKLFSHPTVEKAFAEN
ncbi:MAG: alpha/beta hydrolase [Limisphaerales bacterium]